MAGLVLIRTSSAGLCPVYRSAVCDVGAMPSGGSSQQHAVVDEVLHTLYDGLHSQTAALGLFKKMDLNGTGELRARDLRVSLQRKFGLKLDATRVELVMARLDGDRDGTISVDDFLRGYYRARLGFVRRHFRARSYSGGRAHWVKLFQKYDRDHSGAIDIYEFRRAVRRDAKLSATTVSDDELQVGCATLDRFTAAFSYKLLRALFTVCCRGCSTSLT